jgi:aminoglycoside 6'-N-acetyltransferase I
MRQALWPEEDANELAEEAAHLVKAPGDTINLMAHNGAGQLVGFAEAALRRDYVNGCETTPVVFLEAIYVAPEHRRNGVARALVERVVEWAKAQGCTEFASDALLDNSQSHAMHKALGFVETDRVVFFRRVLD